MVSEHYWSYSTACLGLSFRWPSSRIGRYHRGISTLSWTTDFWFWPVHSGRALRLNSQRFRPYMPFAHPLISASRSLGCIQTLGCRTNLLWLCWSIDLWYSMEFRNLGIQLYSRWRQTENDNTPKITKKIYR